MSTKARSIELFFVDGHPEGMVTATIPFQWSGHVLVSKRTQLRDALQRPEVNRPGVYLLIGESNTSEPLCYIGQSDDIAQRIKSHDANKDWWTTVIFITSNGDHLNKAHVKYLESRLIERVRLVNKINMDNAVKPLLNALSEAARAHMEDFLDNIFLVLPALRFDFCTASTRPQAALLTKTEAVIFELHNKKHAIKALASLADGCFVVHEGSQARGQWEGGASSYAKLYDALKEQGVLVQRAQQCYFAKNYAFNSPSAAGAIVTGRSCNGTTEWRVQTTNQSYKEWEQYWLLT